MGHAARVDHEQALFEALMEDLELWHLVCEASAIVEEEVGDGVVRLPQVGRVAQRHVGVEHVHLVRIALHPSEAGQQPGGERALHVTHKEEPAGLEDPGRLREERDRAGQVVQDVLHDDEVELTVGERCGDRIHVRDVEPVTIRHVGEQHRPGLEEPAADPDAAPELDSLVVRADPLVHPPVASLDQIREVLRAAAEVGGARRADVSEVAHPVLVRSGMEGSVEDHRWSRSTAIISIRSRKSGLTRRSPRPERSMAHATARPPGRNDAARSA